MGTKKRPAKKPSTKRKPKRKLTGPAAAVYEPLGDVDTRPRHAIRRKNKPTADERNAATKATVKRVRKKYRKKKSANATIAIEKAHKILMKSGTQLIADNPKRYQRTSGSHAFDSKSQCIRAIEDLIRFHE